MEIESYPWQVPRTENHEFSARENDYCICVFVINEGERLHQQLKRMESLRDTLDVIVADGDSTDGSTEHEHLRRLGVNTLLVKKGSGKLGTQMRMAFAWALHRGYKGVVCVDGNGKDGVEAAPAFVDKLQEGFDHIQGSRYISGGEHANTPRMRQFASKWIHIPAIRLASGFPYTDTTNGFRAYSAKLLADPGMAVFRDVFTGYEYHYYLAVRAARLGFRCAELPVSRKYPGLNNIPTKISPLRGNAEIMQKLLAVCLGCYNPR